MNRPTIAFVLIIAALVIASRLQGPSDGLAGTENDPVLTVEQENEAMNAAIAEARASLPAFLAHALTEKGELRAEASVKIALPQPSGGAEHVWVCSFRRLAEGRYSGVLDSNVYSNPDLRIGDEIDFTSDMVSDWLWPLDDTNELFGGFTMRVLYADEASLPGDWRFSKTPLPADWAN